MATPSLIMLNQHFRFGSISLTSFTPLQIDPQGVAFQQRLPKDRRPLAATTPHHGQSNDKIPT
jgi:hypothetical protein